MKFHAVVYLSLFATVAAQDAADYYDRNVQELQEKINVQDTVLGHIGGFPQCYHEMQDWADKKRREAPFKSVTAIDSTGVVQLILRSDCRGLRSTGAMLEYYMALTSNTDSVKIEFWNINPKSKECGALFRLSLEKEIADLVSSFIDSIKYTHIPNRGFGESQVQRTRKIDLLIKPDRVTDSIFEAVRNDSIAKQRVKDSIAAIPVEPGDRNEEPARNLAAAQMAADSLLAIMENDSITLRPMEPALFKGQLTCKGKIDVPVRIECLQFLLTKKLRSAVDVLKYLTALQKYCLDKAELLKVVRLTLPDEDKYKAMKAYRRALEDCTKVQGLSERISLSKEECGALNYK
jgi:hypothetical protein